MEPGASRIVLSLTILLLRNRLECTRPCWTRQLTAHQGLMHILPAPGYKRLSALEARGAVSGKGREHPRMRLEQSGFPFIHSALLGSCYDRFRITAFEH